MRKRGRAYEIGVDLVARLMFGVIGTVAGFLLLMRLVIYTQWFRESPMPLVLGSLAIGAVCALIGPHLR